MPNSQTNFVIVHRELSLLFWHFINTTAYHLGQYKPSFPSTTKELHGVSETFSLHLVLNANHDSKLLLRLLQDDFNATFSAQRSFAIIILFPIRAILAQKRQCT